MNDENRQEMAALLAAQQSRVTQIQEALLDWHEVTKRLGYVALFEQFAATAAQRDVQHRLARDEAVQIKAQGFGALRLAQADGGAGVSLPELFFVVRDLARADPNIAHIFRNHFFAVEQHLAAPDTAFARRLLPQVAQGKTLGVAFNELTGEPAGAVGRTPGTQLEKDDTQSGWRISGTKVYSTGNLYADYLLASVSDPDSGTVKQFFVATDAPGVRLDDDWHGFGQKLTGSGTTVFDRVHVAPEDLFDTPPRPTVDTPWGPRVLFGFTFHQVYLTVIITGVVDRILADALALVGKRQRNYYHGLADLPALEPEIQSTIGRIAAWRNAALASTDRAIHALDRAWQHRNDTNAYETSRLSTLAASEAKVVVDETAATLASLLIDVASGSGVSTQAALDRHWRNIKVIASHNPRIYKERVLGDHYLNGTDLPTGAFF
ncbi:acyl-CoA dehydrogenase family protein [Advenella incenata]